MNNKLGVMQGRLLPKYQGRYQAHPLGYWQDEFLQAKEFGLDCIEFILDFNDAEKNPLLAKGGLLEILELSSETGVVIKTVCADYFMEAPLHSIEESVANKSYKVLQKLIDVAVEINITDIVIPCVDQSTLDEREAVDRFIVQMRKIIPTLEKYGVNLSLETDLAPKPFVELLNTLNSKRITVNYDIGNSAALGFNSIKELEAYGHKISDIHIKDRVLGGGPIVLGKGNADFNKFFNKLKEFDYSGPFIMQAYRDDEGLEIFKKQLLWIKKVMQDSYES
jgi:sugar phosphate isomerase/epimerase